MVRDIAVNQPVPVSRKARVSLRTIKRFSTSFTFLWTSTKNILKTPENFIFCSWRLFCFLPKNAQISHLWAISDSLTWVSKHPRLLKLFFIVYNYNEAHNYNIRRKLLWKIYTYDKNEQEHRLFSNQRRSLIDCRCFQFESVQKNSFHWKRNWKNIYMRYEFPASISYIARFEMNTSGSWNRRKHRTLEYRRTVQMYHARITIRAKEFISNFSQVPHKTGFWRATKGRSLTSLIREIL